MQKRSRLRTFALIEALDASVSRHGCLRAALLFPYGSWIRFQTKGVPSLPPKSSPQRGASETSAAADPVMASSSFASDDEGGNLLLHSFVHRPRRDSSCQALSLPRIYNSSLASRALHPPSTEKEPIVSLLPAGRAFGGGGRFRLDSLKLRTSSPRSEEWTSPRQRLTDSRGVWPEGGLSSARPSSTLSSGEGNTASGGEFSLRGKGGRFPPAETVGVVSSSKATASVKGRFAAASSPHCASPRACASERAPLRSGVASLSLPPLSLSAEGPASSDEGSGGGSLLLLSGRPLVPSPSSGTSGGERAGQRRRGCHHQKAVFAARRGAGETPSSPKATQQRVPLLALSLLGFGEAADEGLLSSREEEGHSRRKDFAAASPDGALSVRRLSVGKEKSHAQTCSRSRRRNRRGGETPSLRSPAQQQPHPQQERQHPTASEPEALSGGDAARGCSIPAEGNAGPLNEASVHEAPGAAFSRSLCVEGLRVAKETQSLSPHCEALKTPRGGLSLPEGGDADAVLSAPRPSLLESPGGEAAVQALQKGGLGVDPQDSARGAFAGGGVSQAKAVCGGAVQETGNSAKSSFLRFVGRRLQETQRSDSRHEQLLRFRKICSDVFHGMIFVSGVAAACDRKVGRAPPGRSAALQRRGRDWGVVSLKGVSLRL